MALGNMFQGMARGKVGDVVFAVREGKQVSRVRNRKPKNPQTNKQIMQRAIMATVLQAYSAGKEIFDHSFQGKSVGEQCAREFLSLNTKALRAAIAAEQQEATPLDEQKSFVVLPKANSPVPNAYVVSRGSYTQGFFTVGTGSTGAVLVCSAPERDSSTQQYESIADYAARTGLVNGDLYTLVAFVTNDATPNFVVNGYDFAEDAFATGGAKFEFVFLRMQVKLSDDWSGTSGAPMFKDIFEITGYSHSAAGIHVKDAFDYASMVNGRFEAFSESYFSRSYGAAGVIRSRLDQDLRSNSEMMTFSTVNPYSGENSWGIVGGLAIPAWKQRTAQLGDSDLILEGGD